MEQCWCVVLCAYFPRRETSTIIFDILQRDRDETWIRNSQFEDCKAKLCEELVRSITVIDMGVEVPVGRALNLGNSVATGGRLYLVSSL